MPRNLRDMDEPELQEAMRYLADAVLFTAAEILDIEKPVFVLVLFNDPEIAQYVANCERSTMITAMRETADRLERRDDVTRDPFPSDRPPPCASGGAT
jgi:hypothetical protein